MRDDVVNDLLRLAPPRIAAQYPDTRVCVFATRVAVEVLRYFGVPAKPWPCRVVAMNAIAADGYGEGRPWAETTAAGGYTLGQSGSGQLLDGQGFRWDGHLVALVEKWGEEEGQEAALLLDLSFGDLDRPEKGVHTAPMRAMVPQRLIDRKERIHIPLAEGGIAAIDSMTNSLWRNAPDWRVEGRWRPLVADLIRALRSG